MHWLSFLSSHPPSVCPLPCLWQLLPTRTAPSFILAQPSAHWGLSSDASSEVRGLPEPSVYSSSARSSVFPRLFLTFFLFIELFTLACLTSPWKNERVCVPQSEEHLAHCWIHITKNRPLNAPNGVNRPWRKSLKKIRKPFRGSKGRGGIPNPWILLCHFPKVLYSDTSSHFPWHLTIKIFKQTATLKVFYSETCIATI